MIKAAYCQGDSITGISIVNDSMHSITTSMPYPFQDAPFFMIADDTGRVYFTWASLCSLTLNSVLLRCYDGNLSNIQTVVTGFDGIGITEDHSPRGVCIRNDNLPFIYISSFYDYNSAYFIQSNCIYHWVDDSGEWGQAFVVGGYSSVYLPISLTARSNGKIYAFYTMAEPYLQWPIYCTSFYISEFLYDTCQVISDSVSMRSSASDDRHRSIFVWGDDGKIFLSYLVDSLWSNPPYQISDSSFLYCKNPDIVAENDSTVWVCYQNDGDIYVTRTTIPTGVAGGPEQPVKRIPLSINAYPNPSRSGFRFELRGGAGGSRTASIYDVAGRRIGLLANPEAWDGRDQSGRRAAPGVYFARLAAAGNEKATIKLTIIK